jgi:hypothetical protein
VEVDAWGQVLAGKRGAVDVEIGEWILAAREVEVHRALGFGSFAEYVERRLGFDGHTTAERIRVAEALQSLVATREAVKTGELSWSVARELTRVAVPETEGEWLEAAAGQRVRDVERLVAGRRPAQGPRDPADPRLARHVLRFEVSPETYALWREVVRVMQKAVDPRLTEEEALQELARRMLGGPADEGRAPYQVALAQCPDCGRVTQEARGERVALPEEVLERAECDAQHVGRVDAASDEQATSPVGRARASQTIPPAVRRQVFRRDGGRCRAPGCSNSIWLEVHHLRLRSEGGGHDPDQLALLCGVHHRRLHDGLLFTEGERAAEVRFFHADGTEYGKRPDTAAVAATSRAYSALRSLGFGETESKRALVRVQSHGGPPASVEDVVRAALRVLTDATAAAGLVG